MPETVVWVKNDLEQPRIAHSYHLLGQSYPYVSAQDHCLSRHKDDLVCVCLHHNSTERTPRKNTGKNELKLNNDGDGSQGGFILDLHYSPLSTSLSGKTNVAILVICRSLNNVEYLGVLEKKRLLHSSQKSNRSWNRREQRICQIRYILNNVLNMRVTTSEQKTSGNIQRCKIVLSKLPRKTRTTLPLFRHGEAKSEKRNLPTHFLHLETGWTVLLKLETATSLLTTLT